MLYHDEIESNQILHASFSRDSKLCLALGGSPDYNLVLWQIHKAAKVVASIKLATPSGKSIYRADLSPNDSSIVCVSGNAILRFFRIVDHCFRPITINLNREPQNYTCHCWLPTGQIVLGTSTGDIIIIRNFEVDNILTIKEDVEMPICSIVSFSKGIIAGGSGILFIYNHMDGDKELLFLARKFHIRNDNASITNLALSPSEETLILSTANNQMYSFPLASLDILKEDENNFRYTSYPFHSVGPQGKSNISSMDSCIWKPIIVTCGLDKSVRIWNYEDKMMEVIEYFNEDILDISVHPCGLKILLCCTTSVRLCSILVDGLKLAHEIEIKSCQLCRFSSGGQYFALAYNAFVQIYDTYTCESICTLRGHSMAIKSICWKLGDTLICTIGEDGVMCTWTVPKGMRVVRKVDPTYAYRFGDMESQFKYGFIACTDQVVRRFDLTTMCCNNDLEIKGSVSALAATQSRDLLFIGISTQKTPGALCIVKIEDDGEIKQSKEWQIHSKPISSLHLCKTGKFLFSASEDGSLHMFKILNNQYLDNPIDDIQIDSQMKNNFADEVLVSKLELTKKTVLLDKLRAQFEELRLISADQLRNKDQTHQVELTVIHDEFQARLDQLKKKISLALDSKNNLKTLHEKEIEDKKVANQTYVTTMEDEHKERMSFEAKKLQQLHLDDKNWIEEWNQEKKDLLEHQTQTIRDLYEKYEKKIKKKEEESLTISKRNDETIAQHSITINRIEEDADYEITIENQKFNEKVNELRNQNTLLEQENDMLKKTYDGLVKDLDEQKETVASLEKKRIEMEENKDHLVQILQMKKAAVTQKEDIIAEKDVEISKIEQSNEQLKTFKFDLTKELQNIKEKMEPREMEISFICAHTKTINSDLNASYKERNDLNLKLKDLRLKCQGAENEIAKLHESLNLAKQHHSNILTDLAEAFRKPGKGSDMKTVLLPLFRRYLQSGVSNDENPKRPKNDIVEKQIIRLKKNLSNFDCISKRQVEIQCNEGRKLRLENEKLNKELNDLRDDEKSLLIKEEKLSQECRERAVPMLPD